MRHSCTALLLAALALPFLRLDAQPLSAYQRLHETDGDEALHGVAATTNGYFVVGATEDTPDNTRDALAGLLTTNGNFSWVMALGGSGDDHLTAVTSGSSGDLFAIGTTSSHGAGGRDALVISTSASGTLRWAVAIGTTAHEDGIALSTLPSGDLVALIATDPTGPTQGDPMVVRIDQATGALEWAVSQGSALPEQPTAMRVFGSGQIGVTGTHDKGTDTDMFLAYFDSSGTATGLRRVGSAANETGAAIQPANVLGGAVALGGSLLGNSLDLLLVVVDGSGNVTASYRYDSGGDDVLHALRRRTFNEGFHLCATFTGAGFAGQNFGLAALSTDHQVTWAKSYGTDGDETPQSLAYAPNASGFLIAGEGGPSAATGRAIRLVQTDSAGNAGSCQTANATLTRTQTLLTSGPLTAITSTAPPTLTAWPGIRIGSPALTNTLLCGALAQDAREADGLLLAYPQPAAGAFQVETGPDHGGLLEAWDLSGRRVAQWQLAVGESRHTIQESALPSGYYVLRVPGPFGSRQCHLTIHR